jgi:(p)ppGpp synthase/HD superfamily hydrolase
MVDVNQGVQRSETTTDQRVAQAAAFARERHSGQIRRGTRQAYILHPEGVARILADRYPGRTDLVVAGWLHDTIEDTPTTPGEIGALFGPEVQRLVEGVTRAPGSPWYRPTDPEVMRLKAADALDNVAATLAALRRGEPVFSRFWNGSAKVVHWRSIADATHDLIGDEPIAAELDAAVTEAEAFAAAGTEGG